MHAASTECDSFAAIHTLRGYVGDSLVFWRVISNYIDYICIHVYWRFL